MAPSFNIGGKVLFFQSLFGFNVVRDEKTYVILNKDNLTIHVLNAGVDIGEMGFYLEGDDIDTLWDTIEDKLEGIKAKKPFDREYGMREFHVIIPHAKTLLFAGQAIK
jgi:hypothetical protein